ncbi:MAG: hypothetical protein PHC62_01890 [Candidatus Izemoplasmatales bacterium]|nr:hypothetical protein [Candidatus Izemoplasmatales bacterium]
MKKFLFLFTLLFSFFLLGCSNPSMTALTSSNIDAPISIRYDELVDMLARSESFVLYISSDTCSSCLEFKPILDSFIASSTVVIYQIEASSELPLDNLLIPFTFTPTIVFVEDGVIVNQSDPISNEVVFSDYKSFSKYFYSFYSLK